MERKDSSEDCVGHSSVREYMYSWGKNDKLGLERERGREKERERERELLLIHIPLQI